MRRPPALALLLLLLCAGGAWAQEATIVRIRARSQPQLGEAGREVQAGGRLSDVRIGVRLVDPVGGVPLDRQPVRLHVAGPATVFDLPPLRTDREGQVAVPLSSLPPGRYVINVRYAGDDLRDGAEAELALDLSRRGAQVRVSAPARAPLGVPLRVVVGIAESDGVTPLGGAVELTVAGRAVPIPLRNGQGEAEVALRRDIGAPPLRGGSVVAVVARFAGNEFYDQSSDERQVVVTTQAQVTLDPLPRGEAHQGEALSFSGTVRDEDGPIAGEAVDLEVTPEAAPEPGGAQQVGSKVRQVVGRGLTESQGRFRIHAGGQPLPLGAVYVGAAVVPQQAHRLPGRSEPQRLTVLPPEPVSPLYYLVPILGTLLVLAAFSAVQRRQQLHALWVRLRRAAAPQAAAADEARQGVTGPGVTFGHKSRVQALLSRRGVDYTVDGRVIDASFGRPVAAVVTARPAAADARAEREGETGAEVRVNCDGQGRFTLPGLPTGSHEIQRQGPRLPARALPGRGAAPGRAARGAGGDGADPGAHPHALARGGAAVLPLRRFGLDLDPARAPRARARPGPGPRLAPRPDRPRGGGVLLSAAVHRRDARRGRPPGRGGGRGQPGRSAPPQLKIDSPQSNRRSPPAAARLPPC